MKLLRLVKCPQNVYQKRLFDDFIQSFQNNDAMLFSIIHSILPMLKNLPVNADLVLENMQTAPNGQRYLSNRYFNPFTQQFEYHRVIKMLMKFEFCYEIRIDSKRRHYRILFEIQEVDTCIISFAFVKYQAMIAVEPEGLDGNALTDYLAGTTMLVRQDITLNPLGYQKWTGGYDNEVI